MNPVNDTKGAQAAEGGTRKPYVRPAFRHERVFEVMALACGKIGATQAGCVGQTKTS
jgi:hypothetical protein